MPYRVLEEDDVDRLLDLLLNGSDPLGVGERKALGDKNDRRIVLHVERLLRGESRAPEASRRIDLDPVAHALLRHEGMDPDAVESIAHAAGGIGIRDEDDERVALFDLSSPDALGQRGVRRSKIHSASVTWHQDWTLEMQETLPEIIVQQAPGRLLRDIVSHPALDHLKLRILRIEGRLIRIDEPEPPEQ